MTADTDRATQAIFARLVREHPALTDADRRLMNAFERLMLGRPAGDHRRLRHGHQYLH